MKLLIIFFCCCTFVATAQEKPKTPKPPVTKAEAKLPVLPALTPATKDKLKSMVIHIQQLDLAWNSQQKTYETQRNSLIQMLENAQTAALKEAGADPKEFFVQIDTAGDLQVLKATKAGETGFGKEK